MKLSVGLASVLAGLVLAGGSHSRAAEVDAAIRQEVADALANAGRHAAWESTWVVKCPELEANLVEHAKSKMPFPLPLTVERLTFRRTRDAATSALSDESSDAPSADEVATLRLALVELTAKVDQLAAVKAGAAK